MPNTQFGLLQVRRIRIVVVRVGEQLPESWGLNDRTRPLHNFKGHEALAYVPRLGGNALICESWTCVIGSPARPPPPSRVARWGKGSGRGQKCSVHDERDVRLYVSYVTTTRVAGRLPLIERSEAGPPRSCDLLAHVTRMQVAL